MKIKAILFDLDGTLLPMDQDIFIKAYLGGLIGALAPRGYQPEAIASALWKSTAAMVKNDGSKTNEQVFWDNFSSILGDEIRDEEETLNRFYATVFPGLDKSCGYNPMSKKIVDKLHEKGVITVLATNPLFPAVATKTRMRWAGFSTDDFKIYTTYENSHYCKPNLKYYRDILEKLGLSGEECVMVGNDVAEDMIAGQLGMRVFLLTDNLLNKYNEDIEKYPHGSFGELDKFLDEVVK